MNLNMYGYSRIGIAKAMKENQDKPLKKKRRRIACSTRRHSMLPVPTTLVLKGHLLVLIDTYDLELIARLVAQGHRQEEGIDYDKVFAPIARIEAIRLFLALCIKMGYVVVYQRDVKSAFLYGTIEEEAAHPNKVYKDKADLRLGDNADLGNTTSSIVLICFEKELKDTKQTLGDVVVKLVKNVKSLEIALKRKSKKVIVSKSESEEPEDQGRIIQDIDDDPLVSLVRESMNKTLTI
ncbi:putative ribonuclease H-like domain-containing protein [Tanacetum coccineum]